MTIETNVLVPIIAGAAVGLFSWLVRYWVDGLKTGIDKITTKLDSVSMNITSFELGFELAKKDINLLEQKIRAVETSYQMLKADLNNLEKKYISTCSSCKINEN